MLVDSEKDWSKIDVVCSWLCRFRIPPLLFDRSIAVGPKAFGDPGDLGVIEDHGCYAGGECRQIEFSQLLHFNRKRERVREVVADHDQAVIRKQGGTAAGKRSHDVRGELLGAERRVFGASNVCSIGYGTERNRKVYRARR